MRSSRDPGPEECVLLGAKSLVDFAAYDAASIDAMNPGRRSQCRAARRHCDFIERATPFEACCAAGNGIAAIKKAKGRAPALVILDLSMPMLYSVETASTLRSMVPDAKIIGLAMFAGEFRSSLLAASGFDMIVFKQEGLAKLADEINTLLPQAATE